MPFNISLVYLHILLSFWTLLYLLNFPSKLFIPIRSGVYEKWHFKVFVYIRNLKGYDLSFILSSENHNLKII